MGILMRYERTNKTLAEPVDQMEFTEHMRVDADLVSGAYPYVRAAAAEIETYCDIALLDQDITALADPLTGRVLQLPVGPVALGASVTVDLIEQDGTATPVTDGWFLQAGPTPQLFFNTIPGGQLRITYRAGYGSTSDAIPDDLRMAICDLAARLYDHRASDKAPAFPAAAARISARYRRVRIDA